MAKKKFSFEKISSHIFIGGVLLALLFGVFLADFDANNAFLLFAGIGIVVGLLNITAKETLGFMVAALVLMISASVTIFSLGNIPTIGPALARTWNHLINLAAFAAIIVSIKTVYFLARDK